MTALTRYLRDNPGAFLAGLVNKPLSIIVDGHPDDQANVPGVLRSTSDAGDGTIRGLDRVAWAAITDDGDRHTVTIRTDYVHGADTEPCYWLPWKQNATTRIKVKPSKKIGDAGEFDAYQFRNRRDDVVTNHAQAQRNMLTPLAPARRDAQLFFTAMLTGCSVHIEGATNAPNVFHGNASDMGNGLANVGTRKAHNNCLQDIDRHLLHEYDRFATRGAHNVAHMGARGYEFRMWGNAHLAPKWNHGTNLTGANTQVRSMKAAVFGVCVAGNWQFYGQRVYVYRANGGGLPRQLGTLPQQIWPGPARIEI